MTVDAIVNEYGVRVEETRFEGTRISGFVQYKDSPGLVVATLIFANVPFGEAHIEVGRCGFIGLMIRHDMGFRQTDGIEIKPL